MSIQSFVYHGFDLSRNDDFQIFENPLKKNEQAANVEPPAPPAPTFTLEEMELAKTLAREEGAREAYEKAKAEFDQKLNDAEMREKQALNELAQKISQKIEVLNKTNNSSQLVFTDKMAEISVAIARKVSGDIASKAIEIGVSEIINESIGKIGVAENVKIYLNPKNHAVLNDKFTGCTLISDEKIEVGDFKIEWQNGYAEKDVKKLWQAISETCTRHSSVEDTEIAQMNNNQTQEINNKEV